MFDKLKNIEKSKVLCLKDEIEISDGQVVSKTLVQNGAVGITLFAFSKGEGISSHESTGDAMVYCLYGKGLITIDGVEYTIKDGETIIMPAGHPHAVYAKEDFKMLLTVVF